MKIKLNEIPTEGREYYFNRQTGELNQGLKDLIGSNPYETQFVIRPLNHRDFEIKGFIQSKTIEVCSTCGDQFNFDVYAKLNEILIPVDKKNPGGHYAKSNHVSELDVAGPNVIQYQTEAFDVEEFLHEALAINVPFNPRPPLKDDESCSLCDFVMPKTPIIIDEKISEDKPKNPFSDALKGLKVN